MLGREGVVGKMQLPTTPAPPWVQRHVLSNHAHMHTRTILQRRLRCCEAPLKMGFDEPKILLWSSYVGVLCAPTLRSFQGLQSATPPCAWGCGAVRLRNTPMGGADSASGMLLFPPHDLAHGQRQTEPLIPWVAHACYANTPALGPAVPRRPRLGKSMLWMLKTFG